MAFLEFNNAKVILNGTDISAAIKSVTVNYSSAMLDTTAMGNNGIARIAGLKDWSIDAVMHQIMSCTDSVIFPLVGTSACVEVRPINACASANNPIYSGVGIIATYTPLQGNVGVVLDAPIKMQGSDGNALARASSS